MTTSARPRETGAANPGNPGRERWLIVIALIGFLLVAAASWVRVNRHMNLPGDLDSGRWALVDFRDAIYYPVEYFLDGGNPYQVDTYLSAVPAGTPFPPYSPLTLLIHLPFGWLPHTTSQLAYFGLTITLTPVLAALTLAICGVRPRPGPVIFLATLILVSRPGHWNLMLGQATVELVIAAYLALFLANRLPRISGIALAWSTFKPTFGIPLAILLFAHRSGRAIFLGFIFAATATLIPTIVLFRASGGLSGLLNSIADSYRLLESTESSSAAASPHRIDAFSLLIRWSGYQPGPLIEMAMFIVLILVAAVAILHVRRIATGRAVDLFCLSVACLAILTSSYQLSYNLLLLILPLTALYLNCWTLRLSSVTSRFRWFLMSLLMLPFLNYLAAPRIYGQFSPESFVWLTLTSINGLAVLLAYGIYIWLAFRPGWATPCTDRHEKSEDLDNHVRTNQ